MTTTATGTTKKQQNNFARAAHFFEHFFAVIARPRHKKCRNSRFFRTLTQDNDFLIPFIKKILKLEPVLQNSSQGKIHQHLIKKWHEKRNVFATVIIIVA